MNPDWQETTHLVIYKISVAEHLKLWLLRKKSSLWTASPVFSAALRDAAPLRVYRQASINFSYHKLKEVVRGSLQLMGYHCLKSLDFFPWLFLDAVWRNWYWTPLWTSFDRDGSIAFWGCSYSWRSRHCTLNPWWSFGGGGARQCGWVVIMSYSQSDGSTQTTSWNCFLVIADSYSCPRM